MVDSDKMRQLNSQQKIAIIGTGIAGMGAAYMLNPHHDITVYEKSDVIGGHSRTVDVDDVAVDTGFIVFNDKNYPQLTALFTHLNVPIAKSNMSFGASIDNGFLEYSTQSPLALFAQSKNLFRQEFWGMLRDIVKFNKLSQKYLNDNNDITLGELLVKCGTDEWHKNYFIVAMGAAIWSTPMDKMLEFPAKTFLRFFENHGLLTLTNQPQWQTVVGGSREYVKRLTHSYADKIKLNCGVVSVVRGDDAVHITDTNGITETYDHVVFASHANQVLQTLKDPTYIEKKVLGAFKYQQNRMVLHNDESFMPANKKAWASWIYLSEKQEDSNNALALSYWMNNLQPLNTDKTLIVTLNPTREPAHIHDEYLFEHPLFDKAAIKAQMEIPKLQGQKNTWFCGAYQRYGFHEDGLLSAVLMAEKMGVNPQWT
jgi:uncharacterized protein